MKDTPKDESGLSLMMWLKRQENDRQIGLLKYIQAWGKFNSFAPSMLTWSPEEVRLAYDEATRKLRAVFGPDA